MKGFAIQLTADAQLQKVLKPVFDVRRGSDGKISQGFVIGNTQAQNEALILISNAGEFKNSPRLGVGLENALLGDSAELLKYRHAVRKNYALDGLEIQELDLYNWNKFNIKAKYR